MLDFEILNKAVEKAKANGWKYNVEHGPAYHTYSFKGYAWLIFDIEFAKAFWGDKAPEQQVMNYNDFMNNRHNRINWEFKLQQMVLEPDPLKYIEKFL